MRRERAAHASAIGPRRKAAMRPGSERPLPGPGYRAAGLLRESLGRHVGSAAAFRPRANRTRSIRSTLGVLLVVPLISLLVLWAYAATSTVGGAIARLVRQAVLLSPDGLTMGSSRGLSREDAGHLSALAAGVQSLARGAGRQFRGGDVRQTIIEMDSALLLIATAGHRSYLAVLADADADAGLIAYEMAMLATRVGQHLAASPRFPQQNTVTG
jgi:predicted regulator of Ras-like GTPase activity (Roadblock/LC7/MglB family)